MNIYKCSDCSCSSPCISGCTPTDSKSDCKCVEQMRNVLRQLITMYPTATAVVTVDSGTQFTGRLSALVPASDAGAGLLLLTAETGTEQTALSLCSIVAVKVNEVTYNEGITYLSLTCPTSTGCTASCERAVRSYLPTGTAGASIGVGGQTVAQGTVLQNEYGLLVVVEANNVSPTFVSSCKVESLSK